MKLFLILLGLFALWAMYNGYVKWKGPKASTVAEEMREDVSDSVKKIKKSVK